MKYNGGKYPENGAKKQRKPCYRACKWRIGQKIANNSTMYDFIYDSHKSH